MLKLAWSSALLLLPLLVHGAPAAVAHPHGSGAEPEPVRYQLGVLARGASWSAERTARADSIQAGHMANIGRMAASGSLVAAGPFERGGDLRGIFVWAPAATSLDSMLAGDPAIASGRLVCQLHTWLAPPGLGEEYRQRAEAARRLGQSPRDSMVTFGWVQLHRGPRHDSALTPAVLRMLERHRDHTNQLRASGRLVFAGDVEGTGDLRAVLVMKGDSAEVARAVAADPAVKAGRFTPRILRWWAGWGTIPGH